MKRTLNLMNGDCVEKMKELEDNSVDAILCDPLWSENYEQGFR